MGELDRVHGQRQQRGRQQGGARAQQSATEEVDQNDRAGVEHGGERTPDQIRLVVRLGTGQACQPFDQEERKGPIDEEGNPVVERVERRGGRVEILNQRRGRPKLREHDAEEALVGMQVLAGVPVESDQTQAQRAGQDDGERYGVQQAGASETGTDRARPRSRVCSSGIRRRCPVSDRRLG